MVQFTKFFSQGSDKACRRAYNKLCYEPFTCTNLGFVRQLNCSHLFWRLDPMRNLYRVSLLLAALLVFGVSRASADSLLSYSFSGTNSVTFELPVNPTPTNFDTGIDFEVTPISLMINGLPSSDSLLFFSSTFGG